MTTSFAMACTGFKNNWVFVKHYFYYTGVDEDGIINILTKRTNSQRQQIKGAYQQAHELISHCDLFPLSLVSGLTTTEEKKWRELRRFTLSTLRDFGMGRKTMSERVQEEALCLVDEMATTKGQPFDPRRIIASAVSNVICAVVFGNRFDYKDKTFIENQNIVETQIRHSLGFLGLVYNTFPKTVTFFPGPHQSIFANIEKFCDYIRENVDLHKKTLDPQNLRDYIDCFLLRVEKVGIDAISE
ncbi:PREDICTED: cytochrome P450 2C23-like [Thamnophis sirtalis]|uniref:Cytochrome P450 2C23-like n=1 Tax=Thamnophis sirtalis TaxID=35019 RepID=A0A6I9YME8_9SAUR|nr:PREDICTED: cytochrome P450 2C23-like [Thamnophis sirtalis]